MRMSWTFIFSLSFFLIASGATSFLVIRSQSEKTSSLSVLDNCFSNTSQGDISIPNENCLKKSVNSLLQTYSTTDLMNYIVASTTSISITNNCHFRTHIVCEDTFINAYTM